MNATIMVILTIKIQGIAHAVWHIAILFTKKHTSAAFCHIIGLGIDTTTVNIALLPAAKA